MTKRILIVALLLAAIGGAAVWFLTHYDRVPVREWTGFTGEARRNPYLAFERVVARLGGTARELRSAGQLNELPTSGVVLLPARRDHLTDADRRRLLEWVGHGGHLVVEAEPFGTIDPLLAALQVTRTRDAPRLPGGKPTVPAYTWPDDARPIQATLLPFPPLVPRQARVSLAWNGQNALVVVPWSQGRVTVVSSLAFLRNDAIGKAENATFAWRMLDAPRPHVAVFNRAQKLSLARWLLQNAWPALAGGVLLVALWLARIVPRFGPVAPDAPPTRRRLLDHLLAAGRFHWQSRRAGQLIAAAREAALRHVARLRPDFAAATPEERACFLVETYAFDPVDARMVVSGGTNPRNPAELIRLVALFQRLHEGKTAGGT
jgi:hypothetical protein